ncbi:hypothetical protein [Cereibacter sediminicola]|uniref:hypothetical protein n=1 Tax=Cereibacter sediminicola TaxID=2584941 RepID=UPI0011A0C7E6|nr:hypothetical protein [Cereibacter sediminicola]
MRTALMRLAGPVAFAGALLCAAAPAASGPWAREKGGVFLTLSQQQDGAGDSWTGLWAEYGLTERITLGLDAGRSAQGDGKLILWAQKAWERGPHRIAASAGVGASLLAGEVAPLVQVGGGWGRGITTRFGPGWLAAEARAVVTARGVTFSQQVNARTVATYSYLLPETSAKAEITFGLRPHDRIMWIEQLQFEQGRETGFDARLASSLVYDLSTPLKLELGVILPVSGRADPALKLGIWLDF